MVHGLSGSAACGIFLEQGSKLCLCHWQVDSLSLSHQGSPRTCIIVCKKKFKLRENRVSPLAHFIPLLDSTSIIQDYLHKKTFIEIHIMDVYLDIVIYTYMY